MAANGEVEVAALRSLDDFVLESARFQIPNFKDQDKWANRVIQNLLYYQTNYFLGWAIFVVLTILLYPIKMFTGAIAVAAAFGLFQYVTNKKLDARKFKRDHPFFTLGVILIGGYFIMYMLQSVLVMLLAAILPVLLIFIHASLRLRNMKNKLSNKMETIGLKKSPMGIILEALGQVQETDMLKKLEKKLDNLSPIK